MSRARKEFIEARRMNEHASDILERAMQTLNILPNGKKRTQLLEAVRSYAFNNNSTLLTSPENPIPPEHKRLIRDDCNGNISSMVKERLSPEYLLARKNQEEPMQPIECYRKALKNSVYGREMMIYPTYKAVEHPLMINLINQRLSPEVIEQMRIADFRDFVKEFCYDDFVKYREKEGFVKVCINQVEFEFYHMLRDNGVHPAYVDQLIKNMKEKGVADEFELEYKGQIITGPGFDIDHRNPVYCPEDIQSYYEVNLPQSLALLEKSTHRLKHKLEQQHVDSLGMKTYEKIILPQYCVAMLDFEHYVVHDFDNPERRLQPQRPHGNNLIYLNKINELVNSLDVLSKTQRGRSSKSYINKKGGRQ